MAGKALEIVSIDTQLGKCLVRYPNGMEYHNSWASLDKNTLIVLCGKLGHKFTGMTPMKLDRLSLRDIALSYASNAPIPTESFPQVPTVPAVSARAGTDSVADAVRNVIADALRNGGIDEEAVQSLINARFTEHNALLGSRLDALVSDLQAQIKDNRPQVTQVVLTDGKVVTPKGVQHQAFPKVLRAISRGQHIWMTGSAGAGKTTIAEQVAESLGLEYDSDSYNSQSSKSDIKGYKSISTDLYQSTGFRNRFEHGGVYLLDEIDASNPNILTTLNSALSNSVMGFPDGMVKRHPKFVAIAAANTWGNGATAEHVGRVAIDGATIDRFAMMHIPIDENLESTLVINTGINLAVGQQWVNIVRKARANVDKHGLKVIVSPRASIGGATLLDCGFSWQEAVEMRILKGSKPEVVAKIMEGIDIPKGVPVTV
jgi:MoxR-like ATPase